MIKKKYLLSAIACIGIAVVTNAQTVSKFIDPANMDLTVKPGDDFYMYASGNWIKNNPVPAKETRWGF
jgi:putative endopeptidase